jgi:hypothetical protein
MIIVLPSALKARASVRGKSTIGSGKPKCTVPVVLSIVRGQRSTAPVVLALHKKPVPGMIEKQSVPEPMRPRSTWHNSGASGRLSRDEIATPDPSEGLPNLVNRLV